MSGETGRAFRVGTLAACDVAELTLTALTLTALTLTALTLTALTALQPGGPALARKICHFHKDRA